MMRVFKRREGKAFWIILAAIILINIVVSILGTAYASAEEADAAEKHDGKRYEIIQEEIALFIYADEYGGLRETVVAAKQKRGWTTGGRGARVRSYTADTNIGVMFYSAKSADETIVLVDKTISNEELAALEFDARDLSELVSVVDNKNTIFFPLPYEKMGLRAATMASLNPWTTHIFYT